MAAKNATIVIQPQIDDGVPFFFEFFCKGPHGGEKRHYFLDMMSDVIRFLPDFHHDEGYRSVRLLKPGVPLI
jgi:hypothetical protein